MSRIFEEYGREVATIAVAERNDYFVRKLLTRSDMCIEEISEITKVPIEQVQEFASELA